MTLFELARSNVRGNSRSYLIYWISLVISVMIYFTFVSLQFSVTIQQSIASSAAIRSVFQQASIILILFVAVFVWYSNGFFTKKRKKEVGLYALLGMRKRTIGRMLFYENLIIGLLALVAGMLIGTFLSRMFTMIFLKLLDSAVEVGFEWSLQAVAHTAVVFLVIILLVSIQAYRLIYRFKLTELFKAEQAGEAAAVESRRSSLIGALAAAVLIGFSYWLVFQPMTTNAQMGRNMLLFLIALIIGTYLLFRSAIGYLIRLAQRNQTFYYNGMNLINMAQLLYRLKSNTRTLAMIALLSAVTLCVMSIGYIGYSSIEHDAKEESPFSYMHVSQGEHFDQQAAQLLGADRAHPVLAELDLPVLTIDGDLSNMPYSPSGFPKQAVPLKLISQHVYNQAAAALGREEQAKLAGEQVAIIRPRFSNLRENDYEGRSFVLNGAGVGQSALQVNGVLLGRVITWSFPDVMMVVSDQLFEKLTANRQPVIYKAYRVAGQEQTAETSELFMQLSSREGQMSTYYKVYRGNLESAGLDLFTLGFLGLVFLVATGSMIYFKMLTEATADRPVYAILRKLGVNGKQLYRSIMAQTLLVFALPLVVGLVHCVMILKALGFIQLFQGSITVPVISAMAAYIVIYAVYYLLTVQSFHHIVRR